MNSNSKKFNFLTLSLCFFSILISGCGGIERKSRLTLWPSRELPKINMYDWLSENKKVWLEVRSVEALQSENLAVLQRDGSLIAHPDKTWLRPLHVLVDEIAREMLFTSTGINFLTEQDASQLRIQLFIAQCHYDVLKEKMLIQIRVCYETSHDNWLHIVQKRECKIEDTQKVLLEILWDCLGEAIYRISGQKQPTFNYYPTNNYS